MDVAIVQKLNERIAAGEVAAVEKYLGIWRQGDDLGLPAETLHTLSKDVLLGGGDELLEALAGRPELIRAWEKIRETSLRTDPTWLRNVDDWLNQSLEVLTDGGVTKIKNGEFEIGQVRNETLLVTDHPYNSQLYDFDGIPTGEVINGCQLHRNGPLTFFKRVPDKSPFSADEIAQLKAHPDAHALEKHGFDVTDEALKFRTQTGIAPNGQIGNIVNGSKFNSAEDIKLALFEIGPGSAAFQDALTQIQPGQTGFAIEHVFAETMGYGYRVSTLQRVDDVRTVVAAYKLDPVTNQYYLVTMYPEIL